MTNDNVVPFDLDVRNGVDDAFAEINATQMHVGLRNGKIRVYVTAQSGKSVEGFGFTLSAAMRDALENFRMGFTTDSFPQRGEHVYEVNIVQEGFRTTENLTRTKRPWEYVDICAEVLEQKKRITARDQAHAEELAAKAFGDRPGCYAAWVKYIEPVE